MATTAIYSITSAENQPDWTAKSPRMMAPIMEKEVVRMLGVLRAASFSPSMASSRISSWRRGGTCAGSSIRINSSHPGTRSGSWISRSHTGVRKVVRKVVKNRTSRR